VARSARLYEVPSVAPGNEAVAIVKGGGGFTVIVMAWLAVTPVASATWKVTLALPAPVGIPLMAPPLLRVRPKGRVPEVIVHLNGEVPPKTAKAAL